MIDKWKTKGYQTNGKQKDIINDYNKRSPKSPPHFELDDDNDGPHVKSGKKYKMKNFEVPSKTEN